MKQSSVNAESLHKLMPSMCIQSGIKASANILEERVRFGDDKACAASCSASEDGQADVQSTIPANYNDEDRLFHLHFIQNDVRPQQMPPKPFKNGTRKSLSFSNEKMRDIERTNRILLQKILSKGPAYAANQRVPIATNIDTGRVSSAAVNRRKQQRQIDLDNQLLQKKIEKIARRK